MSGDVLDLKPTADQQKVPDGLARCLYFVLQPSGKAGRAAHYRVAGQTRRLTLGTCRAIDLEADREPASHALINVGGRA